jgi:hypothetical protein
MNTNVGNNLSFSIAYFDANGNEIAATPDSPPTWSDDNATVGDLTQSADGTSAQESILAAGTDDVSVNLTIGGVQFTATLSITAVAAGGGNVASIEIVGVDNGPGGAIPVSASTSRGAARTATAEHVPTSRRTAARR